MDNDTSSDDKKVTRNPATPIKRRPDTARVSNL
jgi:hypothetical protein